MPEPTRFRSKVDTPLVAIVMVSLTLPLIVGWLQPSPTGDRIAGTLIVGSAVAFFVWLLLTTDYTIRGDELYVRSGPLRRRLKISSIERLRATRTWLSAPALSLDRIEVFSGRGRVVISPADKAGFVQAIRARAPHVEVEGIDA